jgi:hypothetical protein
MWYTFRTLCDTLSQPGISIHHLPPAPTPTPDDVHPLQVGSDPSSTDDLPEFSSSTLAQCLVRFIVADDQVCSTVPSLVCHVLTFLAVNQCHPMPGM